MPIRIKNYGRNYKKRKEYIYQRGFFITEVDVSKAKHDACIGTLEGLGRMGFGKPFSFKVSKIN